MRRAMRRVAALGCSMLIASGAVAQHVTPAAQQATAPAAAQMSQEDQEVQKLLNRLTEISTLISRDANAAGNWRNQLAQAEVMVQLASRAKGKEREDWLKMVIDAHFSASVQSPENDGTAFSRMQHLPGQLSRSFPETKMVSYAMLQEIQADYMRVLGRAGAEPAKAQLHLRDRLLRFAEENPQVAEAPQAVMDAAQICETLKKVDDARRCYGYVAQRYSGTDIGRKAQGIQWRLGEGVVPVDLNLHYVYATSSRGDQLYDMKEARGKVVVVYFWNTATAEAEGDFHILKALADRYQFKGLELIFVNLDDDPIKVRDFLSGRLTSGVLLHQKGGVNSEVAQRFGIKSLPEAFLVGKDGNLIKHSLKASQLFSEVAAQLPTSK